MIDLMYKGNKTKGIFIKEDEGNKKHFRLLKSNWV